MGEALATHLVSQGWLVACCDLQRGPGEVMVAALGPNASFFEMNVADYDSQARAFEAVFNKWGRIDALLANAGIADKSSIYILDYRGSYTIPPAPSTLCTDVDYKGIIYGTQLAIHFMRKNPTPGGKIVATSSGAALYPLPTYPEYNGAKAAVIQFIRTVAPVLKLKENILVNCICPGLVPTKLIGKAVDTIPVDCLTPISTIVEAYSDFLSDGNVMTGQVMECSVKKRILVPQTPFLNGYPSQRSCTVWEPSFAMLHHENSDLDDAVP
jgi:NAD(P)-dependent dehydrogenase (short-subunit alcohol dehydrogenase family)